MTDHSFGESLVRSAVVASAPWWVEFYRGVFPDLQSMSSMKGDGWAQRGGIDRVLVLASGKTLNVEEKVRGEVYGENGRPGATEPYDFCLEHTSAEEYGTAGWVTKELATDYLAYVWEPIKVGYVLPFQPLRWAWRKHHTEWIAKYRRLVADNKAYHTISVGVPIPVLLNALTEEMRGGWT